MATVVVQEGMTPVMSQIFSYSLPAALGVLLGWGAARLRTGKLQAMERARHQEELSRLDGELQTVVALAVGRLEAVHRAEARADGAEAELARRRHLSIRLSPTPAPASSRGYGA